MEEIIQIQTAEQLEALNRAEVDIQIATAKQYPRDLSKVLNKISTLATMDPEVASDCFYVLRRGGNNGGNTIEGLSVRMAEIIASSWGNLRVQTRISANDGKTITATGICHDLETNFAYSAEVKRRITDKYGKTFSEDMQVVTGNAAAAIAFRNAVLKVVPKALVKRVVEEAKKVALGESLDLETARQNMIAYYTKIGVPQEVLFDYLSITKKEEIDKEMLLELRATANAIKEGTTTVEEEFIKPAQAKAAEDATQKKVAATKAAVEAAKKKAAPAPAPAPVAAPPAPAPKGEEEAPFPEEADALPFK